MTERCVRKVGTREGYDQWASIYDTEGNPMVALDQKVLPGLLSEAGGLEVVDLGCGTGRYVAWLASNGARVTGLDFSRRMLERAREKLPSGTQASLRQADLGAPLPLPDESFDLVLSSLVLEHLEDLKLFFAEARRICRSHGKIVLSTMHPAMFLRNQQAHFVDRDSGDEVRFESFPHQVSDFLMAALGAGLRIEKVKEYFGDEEIARENGRMEKFRGWPMLLTMVLKRS